MRTIRSMVAFSLVAFTAGCQRETVAEPLALNVGLNAVAMPCSFTTSGTTMTLNGDCTTSASIIVPDGFTLDGNSFTITGVDPVGDHFRGAVVRNGGLVAHVKPYRHGKRSGGSVRPGRRSSSGYHVRRSEWLDHR